MPEPENSRRGELGRAKMDYFEEPPEWTEKPEPSEASMELVMLLTKNMTRVMDLFRKVRRRRPLMPARSPAATELRACSAAQWDTNNDGKISKKEFKRGMIALGFQARCALSPPSPPPPIPPPPSPSPSTPPSPPQLPVSHGWVRVRVNHTSRPPPSGWSAATPPGLRRACTLRTWTVTTP